MNPAPVLASSNPFTEFLGRYDDDWVLLVREVLGGDPSPKQEEALRAACRGERRISIRSGHGVGKTTVLAWIVVCHILTRFPQKTVCTAPTSGQLFDALAAEVKSWIEKLPAPVQKLLDVRSERITLLQAPNDSFIAFNTSRPEKPEAMAGVHSPGWVLLIGDEASGIPEPVYESAVGSMSGLRATTILAGNPTRSSGLFYESHHTLADLWHTIHISSLDCPWVDKDFIEQIRRTYGERSNQYRVRVLGEFPLADDDTVIPWELVESAMYREVEPQLVAPIWGVDVGRFGSDPSALAKRRGNVLMEPVAEKHGYDTMEIVGWVKRMYDDTPAEDRPSHICVDTIGVGSGVYDRLRELGLPVVEINVAEAPALDTEKYHRQRDELWFKGREWFAKLNVNLNNDTETGKELVKPKFTYESSGKVKVESKLDMKKRGERSPNRADALLLTLAVDSVIAFGGVSTRSSWKKPLTRQLSGLTTRLRRTRAR